MHETHMHTQTHSNTCIYTQTHKRMRPHERRTQRAVVAVRKNTAVMCGDVVAEGDWNGLCAAGCAPQTRCRYLPCRACECLCACVCARFTTTASLSIHRKPLCYVVSCHLVCAGSVVLATVLSLEMVCVFLCDCISSSKRAFAHARAWHYCGAFVWRGVSAYGETGVRLMFDAHSVFVCGVWWMDALTIIPTHRNRR